MNDRRKILLGLGATSAVAAWHKPIVNAVLLPAHAQTSPPPPCPDIIVGNAQSSGLSGAESFTSCGLTFDIFSSDPATPLTITAITNDALGTDVTVTNDGLGTATDLIGPRVTWIGPIVGSAPSDCVTTSAIVPVDDVTFTIEATCADSPDPVTLVVTLSAILAAA